MHRCAPSGIPPGMQISFLTPPTSTLVALRADLCARLCTAVPVTIRLDTLQVAERFHILKNLREAVAQELARHQIVRPRSAPATAPPAAPDAVGRGGSTADGGAAGAATPQPPPPARAPAQDAPRPTSARSPKTPAGRRADAARQVRRAARLAHSTPLVALQPQGRDQPTSARRLGSVPAPWQAGPPSARFRNANAGRVIRVGSIPPKRTSWRAG